MTFTGAPPAAHCSPAYSSDMPSGNSPLPTPWNTSVERLSTLVLASRCDTFSQPGSPGPQSCTSMVVLVKAEPELAGSVNAILPFHFGSRRSAQDLGPSPAERILVFCRMTSKCTFVPIQRSSGSRNSAGVAPLLLDAYGASSPLFDCNKARLTPQIISPSGFSRSEAMRRNSTPEPASTPSTAMPVSLVKPSKTRRLRLLSLAE